MFSCIKISKVRCAVPASSVHKANAHNTFNSAVDCMTKTEICASMPS